MKCSSERQHLRLIQSSLCHAEEGDCSPCLGFRSSQRSHDDNCIFDHWKLCVCDSRFWWRTVGQTVWWRVWTSSRRLSITSSSSMCPSSSSSTKQTCWWKRSARWTSARTFQSSEETRAGWRTYRYTETPYLHQYTFTTQVWPYMNSDIQIALPELEIFFL